MTQPRRGEVYLVGFEPTAGAEIRRTRPAVIVQNDIANRWSPITIVAAVTSKKGDRVYPSNVLVEALEGGLTHDSLVLLNHVRSIDRRRLVKRLGRLEPQTMKRVDRALVISFGLTDV